MCPYVPTGRKRMHVAARNQRALCPHALLAVALSRARGRRTLIGLTHAPKCSDSDGGLLSRDAVVFQYDSRSRDYTSPKGRNPRPEVRGRPSAQGR
eukprot:5501759-Prymnesium_polylepis.1